MGLSQTGGGGSVYWRIETPTVQAKGRDEEGVVGDCFTVSIKLPKGWSLEKFISQLKPDGRKRVYFNLPIERDERQIQVVWGKSRNHRGIGGRKKAVA
jgi:hypothetical protein